MDSISPRPSQRSSVQRARNFYSRFNRLSLYEHCHLVKLRADEEKITKLSQIISDIIMYHVVEVERLPEFAAALSFLDETHPLRQADILKELAVFSKITQLDRRGATAKEYEPLLNHGPAPLALLARLADYALTHSTEERTVEHVDDHHSPLFRMYRSIEHAKECLAMDAKAGETLYAPVAERLGFPDLAGDIFKHAYKINHELIHDHVAQMMDQERSGERLRATQSIARKLIKRLKATFSCSEFQVEVVPRLEKHEGKIMRKFYNHLIQRLGQIAPDTRQDPGEFISNHITEYSLSSINDPIALKVVLDGFNGNPIDKMDEAQKKEAIRTALAIVSAQLRILKMLEGYTHCYDYKNKENGYLAHHFDSKPPSYDKRLPIEVQVKTREWDDIASHGKAAHFLYVGGDPEFIEMVGKAYHDVIYRKQNGA